jgi:hypothetical protein
LGDSLVNRLRSPPNKSQATKIEYLLEEKDQIGKQKAQKFVCCITSSL